MFKKITELWPNLVRQVNNTDNERGRAGDETAQPLLNQASQQSQDDQGSGEESGGSGDGIEVDEEQLLIDYKHLYWTRLMQIENYEADEERKWPLGPDVVEEC